ncbi:fumarylacetoacetate hydrolase family protein [Spiractinospora alimapuensis]|uniref:fumarylacetoacetate hydrolase family protein n=1 Tax=Spiractinospora alimapuensis TaxID=2820884 RepID=UPI001F350509|nr:fumarylacetoacetate hydrolase family protein [Spiractinospora alimapuensis]QVQ52653.1 fumarylacetoacetate hydrolase family protein [Spiractinospora alimapuensis]
MRLATIRTESGERRPVVVDPKRGTVAVSDLIDAAPSDTMALLAPEAWRELEDRLARAPESVPDLGPDAHFVAPYTRPRKLWGIGLNYVDHAADLSEVVPDEPASFVKGDHTIIGPGEPIPLPAQSQRVTAEGELGLVIGRYCRDVSEDDALDYVAGVTTVLDQTAEDILERNPRFLTRSKNFPGFFSFGPHIVPLSEVIAANGSLSEVEVQTVIDGEVHRANTVSRMRYSPEHLISFHSAVMPLYPGDIISTGTPGAAPLAPGMVAECRVSGVGTLRNPVVAAP